MISIISRGTLGIQPRSNVVHIGLTRGQPMQAVRGRDQDPDAKRPGDRDIGPKHSKGASFSKADRRRGRPAYLRSPDDTPLRDANRDFMLGVLTARACRTLVVYLQETNLNVAQWLMQYMAKNPLTLSGTWEDISGDTFLRKLLAMPPEDATLNTGQDAVYGNNSPTITVDPRSIAQRILDIRYAIAKELIQDLQLVPEDNNTLLRQSLQASLENAFVNSPMADGDPVKVGRSGSPHPEPEGLKED